MASRAAELEGLHVLLTEEGDLLVPVSHRLVPVIVWRCEGLFVNIKILTNPEPFCLPAI